mmetsp:Transcript_1211/g.1945  ORF Transcript_1211/g.1945 Transcript_1211/m.1945 type:complete len:87 (+) Transcript_1211:635-895(+)
MLPSCQDVCVVDYYPSWPLNNYALKTIVLYVYSAALGEIIPSTGLYLNELPRRPSGSLPLVWWRAQAGRSLQTLVKVKVCKEEYGG